jgi:hypothetical protein
MLVEMVAPVRTKKGTLQPGQVVDLPEEIAARLVGKIRPAFPEGVTMSDLETEFGRDPGWPRAKTDPRWLRHLRRAGKVPPGFTAMGRCEHCGLVYLSLPAGRPVAGCFWCHNRVNSLPIPRPADPAARGGRGREPGVNRRQYVEGR